MTKQQSFGKAIKSNERAGRIVPPEFIPPLTPPLAAPPSNGATDDSDERPVPADPPMNPNPPVNPPTDEETAVPNNQFWSQSSDFILNIAEAYDQFGSSQIVGDFNGDGYADLAIGAALEDVNGKAEAGAVNVLYGSAAGLTIDGNQYWTQDSFELPTLAPSTPTPPDIPTVPTLPARSMFSAANPASSTTSYLRAIATPTAPTAIKTATTPVQEETDSSQAPKTFKSSSAVLIPDDIDGILANSVKAEAGDGFGYSLASGDFNGDGKDDLAVGAYREDVGSIQAAGAVNIIYGSDDGLSAQGDQEWSQNSVGILDAAESDVGEGEFRTGDEFGASVATGDFNGDGYADLLIGVPGEDIAGVEDAGAVNVIYGSATGLKADNNQFWSQADLGGSNTADAYDRFGASLTTGDFNSDGYVDAAVSAPNEDFRDQANAGAVNILYGSAAGLTASNSQHWNEGANNDIEGVAESGDRFGSTLASGDFNNDGYADLAIGTPHEKGAKLGGGIENAGAITVLYGTADGLGMDQNQNWTQNSIRNAYPDGFQSVQDESEVGDKFGSSLTVGDFNRDGYEDIAVGVVGESIAGVESAGAVNILFGSKRGLTAKGDKFWHQNSSGMPDAAEVGDRFGSGLAAGDFNGDGTADLSIGVVGEDIGAIVDAGGVNVLYNQPTMSFSLDFLTADQSIWSSGKAVNIDDERFWGVSWDEGLDWTAAGFGVQASTHGKIGFDSDLDIQGGAVKAHLPINLEFSLPDRLTPGETITIGTGYSLDERASFSTSELYADYKLDFLFELGASLGATSPFGDIDVFNHDVKKSKNLLDIDTRKLDLKLTEDQLAGLGSLDVHFPRLTSKGAVLDLDSLSSQAADDFLKASLDLDRLGTKLLQTAGIPVPNLEGKFDNWLVKGAYNILDVELEAGATLKQDFGLDIDGLTGQLILEDGSQIDFTVGEDITFVVPENIGSHLEIDAALTLDADFRNKTSLAYDVNIGLELLSLKGEFKYDIPFIDEKFNLGPVHKSKQDVLDGEFDIYDRSFDLGGFNTESFSFEVAVA